MPHNHNNNADIWSILSTGGEGFAHALSNFYWGVSITDLAFSTKEDAAASPIPLAVGAVFALLSVGSLYAHQKLNTFHQQNNSDEEKKITPEPQDEKSTTKKIPLTKRQKLALVSDFFAHTGDISGAVTAGIDLITRNYNIPRYGSGLIQLGATLFGATTAVASVRNCGDAIKAQNHEESTPSP